MKLTILGCYGPYPSPQGACSSYLVEGGGVRILLDMGNGSLANLERLTEIDACLLYTSIKKIC